MLIALALTAFAQSIDVKDAPTGHLTALPSMTFTHPPARSLEQESSTLWSSGATVEVMGDGLLLDGELLVRFSAWGRSRHSEEVSGAEPFFDCVPTPFDGGGCVVGPTWAHEGIDVWWAELDAGLELGWTVYEPPVGPGPLTLSLDLEGALMVRADEEGAQVLSASRRQWSVGRTVAWDADGVELPTLLRVADGGLEVVVDDSKARYPIVVDPTLTTPRVTLSGTAGGQYGLSLVSGDFDADGSQDLAVGDPVNNIVRIYRGDRIFGGLSTTAAYSYTGSDAFGSALDMGDINGDGRDDLVIGSRGREFAVVLGTSSGTPPIERRTVPTNSPLGLDLSAGSDFNNDGFDDIVVQETGGRVQVCYGNNRPTLVECLQTIGGVAQYSTFSSAEDLNGDGYGDFVVGAWAAESVQIFFGSLAGIALGASYDGSTFAGVSNTGLFGYRIETGGDLNGDGRNDLAVANMLGNQVVLIMNIGSASPSYTVVNSGTAADFGSAVEMGDVNGDGRDDLIVGARDVQQVLVFHGHPTQLIDTNAPVVYFDSGGSTSFGDEELAVIDDNDNRPTALLAIGSYSTNQVKVFDGWRDNDNDGYGPTDCNDNDAAINPGAPEVVGNSVDENCSGTVACFVDADDDNYRTDAVVEAPPFVSCGSMGYGLSTDGIDCNDTDASINAGATEVAGDGVDSNCNGSEICYIDADFDGARSTSTRFSISITCAFGDLALAADPIDCDDARDTAYPGATEVIGDGVDNDCDGFEVCYQDLDNDGARTDLILIGGGPNSCTGAGQGLATDPIDCNDGNAAINPSATEVTGDGVDGNCNGFEICYVDADRDGARSTTTRTSTTVNCSLPDLALTVDPIDCNDASNTIFPGATDAVADGVDSNCDGSETCYVDADLDGARSSTTRASTSITCASADLALAVDPVDCNDTSSAIRPGATEGPGDGVDSDCDGSEACYVDADQDGARSDNTRLAALSCTGPDLALATDPVDCDDTDDAAYPGAPDAVADGVDSSCDGLETCYIDADLDGARTDLTRVSTSIDCDEADLALATAPVDCDDADPFYNSTCPVFFLRPPTPGTVGAANTIRIEGATPGARVVLLGGRPGTTFVPCGTFVDMAAPNLLSSGVANAAGVVTFTVTPPPTVAGRTVTLQAAMPAACAVSSSYVWTL